MQAIRTCTHTRATAGLDNAYCSDCKRTFKPKSKEYQEILTRPCSDTSIFSPELAALQEQQSKSEESAQLNSSSLTVMHELSCDRTSPISPSTPTSELTPPHLENLIYLQEDSPAQVQALPDLEQDSITQKQPSGGKCSESLLNADPDSLLSRIQKVCLSEELESVLPLSEWQDIVSTTLGSYQQRNSEQCTSANESLSCPTLTSGSKTPRSRAAGTTKCEQWFKQKGLVPNGYQLSAPAMAKLMGHQEDWFKALCPSPQLPLAESEPDTLLEDVCVPLKPESPCNGSSTSITLIDPLTYDEERDLAHLERKVERAFYEAGKALEEIRDRKLYRASHRTFEVYCKDRFGYSRRKADYAIAASLVVDNLEMRTNGSQNEMSANGEQNKTRTNCSQILPTSERQVRALVSLPPDEQRQVWQEALQQSNGKIPTGAKVKGIVEQLKEKTFVPLPQRSELSLGDVVKVKAKGNSTLRPYDGYWGVIEDMTNYFYHIGISVKNKVIQCKGDEVERLELGGQDRARIHSYAKRIKALTENCELSRGTMALLEALQRDVIIVDADIQLLEKIEEIYGYLTSKS